MSVFHDSDTLRFVAAQASSAPWGNAIQTTVDPRRNEKIAYGFRLAVQLC